MPANSRVLLVDRDVDALALLAAQLREHGIRVSLANGPQMACERARTGGYDVVLAARAVAEPVDGGIGVIDALSIELPQVPPLLVLDDEAEPTVSSLRRDDIPRIVSRIKELTRADRPPHTSLVPSAHALDYAPLADLLVVLATERRSGTITITTAKGSGEVRLLEGEVADAVYVRLEGMKAIARMFSERDGTATFTPGAPAIMRRIHQPTRQLVDEARRLVNDHARLLEGIGDLATTTLVAIEGSTEDASQVIDGLVLSRLRVPATLEQLLDELPQPDSVILASLIRLDKAGRVKRLGEVSSRVQLCGPDQLHLVRASASRARASGFGGAARLVFAATPSRLAVFGHTVLSLADAFASQEPAPSVPVPYAIATIRLGDGVDIDVIALPLVPAYAPLWPMVLAGAAVVVRLDAGASESLEQACSAVYVSTLDAQAIFGTLEESSAVQVATLIRTALEAEGTLGS